MRVALVVAGGVDRSGREKVIPALLSLIERLTRRHDVAVYVLRYLDTPCSYPLLGATVHDLGRPQGLRRQYVALVNALRRHGLPDVLHGYWGLPSGAVAVAAGRRLRIPSIVTCDSGEFVALPEIGYGSQVRPQQRAAISVMCRFANRITVCSEYQARLARAKGVEARLIPIGIDTRAFTPARRAEGPPWRIINVARQSPVKDHDTLLRAFALLVQRGVEVHLDVVGEDTTHGAVAGLTRDRELLQHVRFHGFLPQDVVVPMYQRSHLAVQASRHEAASVAALEAAASGVPVAGTAVGYVADWAPDRAEGVPPKDPAALAAAIHGLLLDRSRRERIADAALQWTRAHDADWTAAQFVRLYEELRSRP